MVVINDPHGHLCCLLIEHGNNCIDLFYIFGFKFDNTHPLRGLRMTSPLASSVLNASLIGGLLMANISQSSSSLSCWPGLNSPVIINSRIFVVTNSASDDTSIPNLFFSSVLRQRHAIFFNLQHFQPHFHFSDCSSGSQD